MTEKSGEQRQKRLLILCVDRDGDLAAKAGINTPLVGRTVTLDAAVALALKDPEEPDANAMFEAVSLYDRLLKEKKPEETFEIATICGTELGGVSADRKLVAELITILDGFNANEVILVTDGYTDEAVLPLVESRVPVSSVRRIVVKHSESIEETAQLFAKYTKMLVQNPKYSRIALGLPGTLIFIWLVLALFQVSAFYYLIAILFVASGFMLIKGFGVDRAAKNLYTWAREYSPPPLPIQIGNYATIAGILCIAVSLYSGYTYALSSINKIGPLPTDTAGWLTILPMFAGYFLKGSLDLIIVGCSTVLIGRAISAYFDHDVRLLRNIALIVSVIWCRMIFDGAADVLINSTAGVANLVFYIVVGILIAIASVLVMLIVHRSAKDFFVKPKGDVDEFGGK
jgi:putative membrane protein